MEWERRLDAGHPAVQLRNFMRRECGFSASLWKRIKWGGSVAVNGVPVRNAKMMLAAGDHVVCRWSEESDIVPISFPLSVVYEDDALLVVDKPAGMMIHPTHKSPQDTLVNAVAGYFLEKKETAGIHPVYRLDRNTTGLVVVAKSAKIQYELSKSHDLITRHYIAFVSGHLEEAAGRIEAPIGRVDGSCVAWQVREDGKRAVTAYEVLSQEEDFDIVRLRLFTGRTHQIRVHMAHLGHPLLGDDFYGGPTDRIAHQALHAADVSFIHPVTGKPMDFSSPLPEDMRAVVRHPLSVNRAFL